jgi:hypothetical protein
MDDKRYEEDVPRSGKKKKKGKLTREDFKADLVEAMKKAKPKKKRAARKSKYGKAGSYDNMSVAELRTFLNQKKKNVLIKSGFPNGALPRSKAAMIQLCKALKRKRW